MVAEVFGHTTKPVLPASTAVDMFMIEMGSAMRWKVSKLKQSSTK